MRFSPAMPVSFEDLRAALEVRAIPSCPGRFILAVEEDLTPAELVGAGVPFQRFVVAGARDAVLAAEIPGGGLIIYERSDGTYLHTLNTPEGLARKLAQLGIRLARATDEATAAEAAAAIELPAGDVLDLHRFAPGDVAEVVAEWLTLAAARGLTEVRLIHGKGKGVQRRIVRSLLERHPAVASSRTGAEGEGGWGATVVSLRPDTSRDTTQ